LDIAFLLDAHRTWCCGTVSFFKEGGACFDFQGSQQSTDTQMDALTTVAKVLDAYHVTTARKVHARHQAMRGVDAI
jgi:hypothetical protein